MPTPTRTSPAFRGPLTEYGIDAAVRAGVDKRTIFSTVVRQYDASLPTAVRSAAVADSLGTTADQAWVAAALEKRWAYYAGIAKRLGISPKRARSLSSPTITVVDRR